MNSRTRKSGTSVRWNLVALAAVVSLMVFGFSHASANDLEKTAAGHPTEGKIEPFLGEAKFEIQPMFDRGRIPNVAVATDGTVLATHGGNVTYPAGGRGLLLRRSEDGGRTWGNKTLYRSTDHGPITISKRDLTSGGHTVDETSGDILAFSEWCFSPSSGPLTISRSTDHGKTWKVQDTLIHGRTWKLQKTVIHKDKNGNVPSMSHAEHGITLRHGKYKGRLLRAARWMAGDARDETKHYTTAIYSDDGGRTWRSSDPFPVMGTGEGAVAELSDGRIYYNSRRHYFPKDVAKHPMRYEAWSDDGGATWKDMSISKVLPDGPRGRYVGNHGGLVRLPVRGRDIILYSNCDTGSGARRDVTVWVSFDGAKTWPIKRLALEGPGAYSSLAAGRPGTPSEGWIYLLLEAGNYDDGASLARFNLSWVLEGEKKTGDGELPKWLPQ
jgi:sialidase-1